MSGAVKVVSKALGGGDSKPAASPAAQPKRTTARSADTQLAMQRQASLRARRGRGGVFNRMLGSNEDTLGS